MTLARRHFHPAARFDASYHVAYPAPTLRRVVRHCVGIGQQVRRYGPLAVVEVDGVLTVITSPMDGWVHWLKPVGEAIGLCHPSTVVAIVCPWPLSRPMLQRRPARLKVLPPPEAPQAAVSVPEPPAPVPNGQPDAPQSATEGAREAAKEEEAEPSPPASEPEPAFTLAGGERKANYRHDPAAYEWVRSLGGKTGKWPWANTGHVIDAALLMLAALPEDEIRRRVRAAKGEG